MMRVSPSRFLLAAAGSIIAVTLIVFSPVLHSVTSIPIAVFSNFRSPAQLDPFPIDRQALRQCSHPRRSLLKDRCPDYFSWIDADLSAWKDGGISLQSLEEAKKRANFRVAIINGTLYTQQYHKCFQTRDDLTLKGLFLLLHRFPGMVPDVDLMFGCGDFPSIPRSISNDSSPPPPPLFSYCTTAKGEHYDIVFPDWSFWGWPEINILPWEEEKQKIFPKDGDKWSQRLPFAYWKGNYWTGVARPDLVRCSENKDLNSSRLLTQNIDWNAESSHGFQSADMSKQCQHRYKVYVEGRGWSASLKYIMACGSTVLFIDSNFHEFFSRSLRPFVHFWPVKRDSICVSIRDAVEWGNANPKEAEAMGKCARAFVERELNIDFIYQYILFLLQRYHKLLRFKPVVTDGLAPFKMEVHNTTSKTGRKLCTMDRER